MDPPEQDPHTSWGALVLIEAAKIVVQEPGLAALFACNRLGMPLEFVEPLAESLRLLVHYRVDVLIGDEQQRISIPAPNATQAIRMAKIIQPGAELLAAYHPDDLESPCHVEVAL